MPYIPHTPEETAAMLSVVGVKSIDDLFSYIPQGMRAKKLPVPDGMLEHEVADKLAAAGHKNKRPCSSFMGAGFYNHVVPAAVDALSGRGEFYTAYTPYQAEAAQGTLQAIFEFQTAMCRLMEMDISNASVYDGGSALFEAAMMAIRQTRRNKIVVDESVNPFYRDMLNTLTAHLEVEIVTVPQTAGVTSTQSLINNIDNKTAAVLTQNPNFFGTVADYTEVFKHAASVGAISVLATYPVMQSVLKTPHEMGANIATADGQSIGQYLNFGGPYLGIMTCDKSLARQMPGRIVGRTTDVDGKTGYVLTLQAREQHIRRAKATSNICSNQALIALRTLIHLCLLGPDGLRETAERGMELARYAQKKLLGLPGIKALNDQPFGNEFAVILPIAAAQAVKKLEGKGIVPGVLPGVWYKDMENVLLVACTEKNCEAEIDAMVKALGEAI